MRWHGAGWSLLLLALSPGCRSGERAIAVADTRADGAVSDTPRPTPRPVDLLFVVDNTPRAGALSEELAGSLGVLLGELDRSAGGRPDLHVGVVSSDLGAGLRPLDGGACPRPGGDRGRLHKGASGCGLDADRPFISTGRAGALDDFRGDVNEVFRCLCALGDSSCGYRQPLEALRLALDERATPENRGFLRSDTILAVVIISIEDDCSAPPDTDLYTDDAGFPGTVDDFRCAQAGHLCSDMAPPVKVFEAPFTTCQANRSGGRLLPVSPIADAVKALKKDPARQLLVAGIFGWPLDESRAVYRYARNTDLGAPLLDDYTTCGDGFGWVSGGLRLAQFVGALGGSVHSWCAPDPIAAAMRALGSKLAAATR